MADFYLDEDVSLRLVPALEALSHGVLAAKRSAPCGIPDHEQFAIAVRAGRILVTHNEDDFLSLHRAWRDWFAEWGTPPLPRHAGIIALPQSPILNTEAAAVVLDQLVSALEGAGPLDNRFYHWSIAGGWEEIT